MTTGIKNWSTTAASNNASPPNGFPEGMAPASLNDSSRQVMASIREWYEDPTWIDFGDTPTQTGASTFTVSNDVTARYAAGRRIRMIGTTPFTLYGTIASAVYSAPNTTVTVTMDSGSLDSTLSEVAISSASIGSSGLAILAADNSFTGKIRFPDKSELTISSGAVTVTGVYHTIDTESDAATDNLDTINGGSDGQVLIIQSENSSRDVVITTAGNIVSPNGNITLGTTSDCVSFIYSGALSKWVVHSVSVTDPVISSLKNRVLNGLTMSNNVSDATNDIDVAAGSCVSDDGTTVMTLSAITKRLDAAWAVGTNQGGLDTGSIANATYHVWVIHRTDTGVTDVLFSTSASSPTMPANYDKKKCIGSIVRASAAILAFTQLGRKFILNDGPLDVNVTNLGTSATDYTISAPSGVRTIARVRVFYEVPSSSGAYGVRVYSKSEADEAISQTNKGLPNVQNYQGGSGASTWSMSSELEILTNTSAQIRAVSTVASTTLRVVTVGWEDYRI